MKYSAIAQHISDTTLFLARLNFAKQSGLPDFLALLYSATRRLIDLTRFLFNQGKLRRCGGSTLLGMLSSIIDRNWEVVCGVIQLYQKINFSYDVGCVPFISHHNNKFWYRAANMKLMHRQLSACDYSNSYMK